MTEIMNCLNVLALFAVFGIGLVTCCNEAKRLGQHEKLLVKLFLNAKPMVLKLDHLCVLLHWLWLDLLMQLKECSGNGEIQ